MPMVDFHFFSFFTLVNLLEHEESGPVSVSIFEILNFDLVAQYIVNDAKSLQQFLRSITHRVCSTLGVGLQQNKWYSRVSTVPFKELDTASFSGYSGDIIKAIWSPIRHLFWAQNWPNNVNFVKTMTLAWEKLSSRGFGTFSISF